MATVELRNALKHLRLKAGLQQKELAERAGVSRQTLSAVEAGESVPATSIALQLARVLGCRVEDIFSLSEESRPLDVALIGEAAVAAPGRGDRKRVAIAEVGARWVAHLLDGESGASAFVAPADGLLPAERGRSRGGESDPAVRVTPLRTSESLRENLFCAGCDPALALLGGHLHERFQGARLHWIEAGSSAALEMLARGEVHVAGLHLYDEDSGDFNVAVVRRRFGGRGMVLVNLAVWEQGLVVAEGNPKKLRKMADLTRKGVRVIGRERGTGSDELFTRLTVDEGIPRKAVSFAGIARGHMAVAAAVAAGTADTGIATRAAAASHGLDFLPLAETRFDLAMSKQAAADLRLQRLLDVLGSARFRRDLGGLTGYGSERTGQVVAELAP
jgi:putative molybdopterin biosynthesis protein